MRNTLLTICAGVVLLLGVAVTAHNITYGYIGPYDRSLANISVVKRSSWFSKQTAEVVYPPKGHFYNVLISAIRVIDKGGPKNFCYSQLVKGGPGQRNATIYLQSQSGKALNATLQFYGRYL